MNKNKENAQTDWTDMIVKSWTWEKLTREERKKFGDELNKETTKKIISGTYSQRWEILRSRNSMYVEGCGYNGGS